MQLISCLFLSLSLSSSNLQKPSPHLSLKRPRLLLRELSSMSSQPKSTVELQRVSSHCVRTPTRFLVFLYCVFLLDSGTQTPTRFLVFLYCFSYFPGVFCEFFVFFSGFLRLLAGFCCDLLSSPARCPQLPAAQPPTRRSA